MPRPLRPLAPGLTYHVTARGNRRQELFRDDHDRRGFLGGLWREAGPRGWQIGTYCLMGNHVHLVIRTPDPDLSGGLQQVFGRYARHYNDRHGLDGHLFQDRFHSVLLQREPHHLEVYRYVAMNPVRAELCATPEAWRWSAHAALLGLASPPLLLDTSLWPFDGDRSRYAAFVADAGADYLTDLLGDGSPLRIAAAIDAGFTQRQIASATGRTQSAIARALGRLKGV